MKLSDVKGERVFDVIADIIEPVSKIASDERAKALFAKEACPDGITQAEFMRGRIVKNLPLLLKEHKAEIIAIMAAVKGVSPEELAEELNIAMLMKEATELLSDKAFIDFFA